MLQNLFDGSDLQGRNSFYNSLDTVILSLFVALGVSFIFFIIVQCLPKIMNYLVVVVGLVIFVAVIICIFTYGTNYTGFKIALGIVLLILLLLIVCGICKNREAIRVHGIFLSYGTKVFSSKPSTFFYILFFLAILVLFVMLLMLEFTGYWTSGSLNFTPSTNIYKDLTGQFPTIMTVLLFIQGIWGLGFIK